MTRPIAAIDIGTNSVLMLVCRRSANGPRETIVDRARVTRLGRGVDASGQLDPAAIQRTLDALDAFAREARAFGASIHAVGTSALRDARRAAPFLEPAARLLGVPIEIIDGAREAELCFEGALDGLLVTRQEATVIDVGGGSTEIVRLEHGKLCGASLDIGAVRFTERYAIEAPTPSERCAELKASAERALREAGVALMPKLVATAGTATALAAIIHGLEVFDAARVHGTRITKDTLASLIDRLAPLSLQARAAVPGLGPERADVVIAGACILHAACDVAGADQLLISCGGLRVGLAHALLRQIPVDPI